MAKKGAYYRMYQTQRMYYREMGAVSYTHLDVYKRQAAQCISDFFKVFIAVFDISADIVLSAL